MPSAVLPFCAVGMALVAALASCIGHFGAGGEPSGQATAPCLSSGPVTVLAQGPNGGLSSLTVSGGLYELTADHFPKGGIFDPDRGVTRVWIGAAGTEPAGDVQRNPPTQVTAEVYVREGQPTQVTLAAGEFWVANSFGVRISGRGCDGARLTSHRPGAPTTY